MSVTDPSLEPMPTLVTDPDVVVIGAGPAGLTAAYELGKRAIPSTVLEADEVVGGISRTVERNGWRFDIGGHRFFTKVPVVRSLWHEILPEGDFLTRRRLSRIYYDGKYLDYPLRVSNVLRSLGILESVRCVLSYLWVRIRPPKDQSNFEGWTAARFGWRLYHMFFKTYTEKVWGVPADAIQADWAAQRIKNLSFVKAVTNALLPSRNQTDVTSLIEQFEYPRLGPGMMWERCLELVTEMGSDVRFRARVQRIQRDENGVTAVEAMTPTGSVTFPCTHVISSMPFSSLLLAMDPPAPQHVQRAAQDLAYRDFLTVALVIPADSGFPDNWIYIHSADVKVGRIQNFGSWSPDMVKDGRTCLGLEYFVNVGDDLWDADDEELIALATRELAVLGLADADEVEQGFVVRMEKAYPMYDEHYQANVAVIREWMESRAPNVYPVGRNGMHRYNNQDHSMLTALLSVENILGAENDIWSVNVEEDYHEEVRAPDDAVRTPRTGRDAPIVPREAYRRVAVE